VLDERAMDARYPGQSYDTRSDHANFRRRGIPAIAFFTGPHADYHETTDDADKVNYEALRRVTQLAYDIAAAIAAAPSFPVRK
jgi:Zn-dependent M28 family amino/carboxypeptidase